MNIALCKCKANMQEVDHYISDNVIDIFCSYWKSKYFIRMIINTQIT